LLKESVRRRFSAADINGHHTARAQAGNQVDPKMGASRPEAGGAFGSAYQQGLDGMGISIASWMGLIQEEYDGWMRNEAHPARKSKK
jgi:hypothetical protein